MPGETSLWSRRMHTAGRFAAAVVWWSFRRVRGTGTVTSVVLGCHGAAGTATTIAHTLRSNLHTHGVMRVPRDATALGGGDAARHHSSSSCGKPKMAVALRLALTRADSWSGCQWTNPRPPGAAPWKSYTARAIKKSSFRQAVAAASRLKPQALAVKRQVSAAPTGSGPGPRLQNDAATSRVWPRPAVALRSGFDLPNMGQTSDGIYNNK
jgi:hypothetical protein